MCKGKERVTKRESERHKGRRGLWGGGSVLGGLSNTGTHPPSLTHTHIHSLPFVFFWFERGWPPHTLCVSPHTRHMMNCLGCVLLIRCHSTQQQAPLSCWHTHTHTQLQQHQTHTCAHTVQVWQSDSSIRIKLCSSSSSSSSRSSTSAKALCGLCGLCWW